MSQVGDSGTCAQCGAANPRGALYCGRCGVSQGAGVRSATRVTPLLRQWRSLSVSLIRREVRALLGEPLRISHDAAVSPALEIWTYAYEGAPAAGYVPSAPSACPDESAAHGQTGQPPTSSPAPDHAPAVERIHGVVRFDRADGRVIDWTEPDWLRLGA